MRRRFLVFFILVNLGAINARAENIRFTVLGLYGLSNMTFESTSTNDFQQQDGFNSYTGSQTKQHGSFSFGALFEFPLQQLWSLETGVVYLERGYRKEIKFFDETTSYIDYKWKNIFIPLVGRFRPTKMFTGFIGGYYNVGVGKVSQKMKGQPEQTDTFKNNGLKTADYGLTYGAGLNLKINNKTDMLIELRFNEGLTNSSELETVDQFTGNRTETKAKMTDVWLVLGFLI
ncbi:MAG: porin family protein [Pseudobdellovibrionaceae bacterium]